MNKKRILLELGLICLAAAFGWYFHGVSDHLVEGKSALSRQARVDLTKAVRPQVRSALEFAQHMNLSRSETVSRREDRDESRPTEWPAEPPAVRGGLETIESLPPTEQKLSGDERVVSADKMTIQVVRPRAENARDLHASMAELPPDVRPEDIESVPGTGMVRIVRRVPGSRPTEPPAGKTQADPLTP